MVGIRKYKIRKISLNFSPFKEFSAFNGDILLEGGDEQILRAGRDGYHMHDPEISGINEITKRDGGIT
jgi:hypothetical protein